MNTLITLFIKIYNELNPQSSATDIAINKLNNTDALKTLIKNNYRYFMIEKLGSTGHFLQSCAQLARQIATYQLTRPKHNVFIITPLIKHIEHEQHRKITHV